MIGLMPASLAVQVEVDRPEQVAVVGNGHGRHLHLPGGVKQVLEPDGPVQQAVLGVQMEMDEFGVGHDYSHSIVLGGLDEMS